MKQSRVHYIQHAPFEGLGCIESWATEQGNVLTYTRIYEEVIFPEAEAFDILIIMGGPMSVNDPDEWIVEEKHFIKSAIDKNKKVLGICLGAQFIASVLGAKVYPNKEKEIGWFPVTLTKAGLNSELLQNMEEKFIMFHWHGETFDLPENAVHLISSEGCINQAFSLGDNVLGLQFHPEFTKQSFDDAMHQIKTEITPGKFIQAEQDIVAGQFRIEASNHIINSILQHFLQPLT
jgi:GMP synthase-like glutamine amidotransferase